MRSYRGPASGTCAQRRMRPSACVHSRAGLAMTRSIQSSRIITRSGRDRTAAKYAVTFIVPL
jgi:hypothetical protein